MSSDNAIAFAGVWKEYKRGGLRTVFDILIGRNQADPFWALQDVSFTVKRGSTFGVIGPNGAGKSTILKLLAGVTYADKGHIDVSGRIAPMIELGAGFHPELTARENTFLVGALLGLTKRKIETRFAEIIEFAGLDQFVDTPVKNFSSGMFARLGFSIAIHTDPAVLLVDEVLAVGDEQFQRKSIQRFSELKKAGCTTVFVSHDLGLVAGICDEILLLSSGKVVETGAVDRTVGRYLELCMGDVEGTEIVRSEDMLAVFGNGKLSLFVDDTEITTRWGVYTSMLMSTHADVSAQTLWIDSTKAVWHCEKNSISELICVGEFIAQPMKQYWRVTLGPKREIKLEVDLELSQDIYLERSQMNAMLHRNYGDWSVGDSRGNFPKDFTSRDYHNWDVQYAEETGMMTASSHPDAPNVTFCRDDGLQQLATVVNSSFFFSGRVLMFLDMDSRVLRAGRYRYFIGSIRVGDSV